MVRRTRTILKSKALKLLESKCRNSLTYQTTKVIIQHIDNNLELKVNNFSSCQNSLRPSQLTAQDARPTPYDNYPKVINIPMQFKKQHKDR